MSSLALAVRKSALASPEVNRISGLRRSTSLFSQSKPAEAVYLIEEGLVKLTRSNVSGKRIILSIRGPEHLVGDEALADVPMTYYADAEILTEYDGAGAVGRVGEEADQNEDIDDVGGGRRPWRGRAMRAMESHPSSTVRKCNSLKLLP